jgi:ABC-type sugar transport system ATPase subunit
LTRELGATAIYVTHDQTEALGLADRVVFLDEGRIVEQGPRAALQADDGRFARLLSDAGLAP